MKHIFNDTEYTVKKLTVKEITTDVVEHVRKKALKDIQDVAQMLVGEEKRKYLIEERKSLPTETEVLENLDKWLGSIDGVRYILEKACTPQFDLDITKVEEIEPILNYALGDFVTSSDETGEKVEGEKSVPFGA